uniref:class I SAM-dependent methyltransferase n=1 Tax=Candidatus Wunengus sp. YC65 TaxID=3367701 RepID=UPI0040279343
MLAKKNTTCRYCGSNQLSKILSLGSHPPSNSFVSADQIALEKRYPLDVYLCEKCFLVQLLDVVPAEAIFSDYVYLSSSSKALKDHYAQLANYLTTRFLLKEGDRVVDVGCNDGILLHGYSSPYLVKIGVEPSKLAEIAKAAGMEVVNAFFSREVAKSMLNGYGTAKLITATNVFAHVDDIKSFVEGVVLLLADNGVFVIEAPYLIDLIDHTLFDTIYHEHLCYLSLTPMVRFLSQHDLEVFDVERVAFGASGPAIRVFVRKKTAGRQIQDSVPKVLTAEERWGVGRIECYMSYAEKVENLKRSVLRIIEDLRSSGAHIGGYGAPAKGNTLLNYFGITSSTIDCIAETNKLKQGLYTPGSHIPVVNEEEFLNKMPEYALLLSWNYLDFFLKNSDYIRKGGRFIVPIPVPRIVP